MNRIVMIPRNSLLTKCGRRQLETHRRSYKNFGHRKNLPGTNTTAYEYFMYTAFCLSVLDYKPLWAKFKVVFLNEDPPDSQSSSENNFKHRKIVAYENRIRNFSSADKIFRYFATVKLDNYNNSSEAFMTPYDFLRAIMPGLKQPDAPKKHFRIAFKMLDFNGDGNVDFEEFQRVSKLVRSKNSFWRRHFDNNSSANYQGINSALMTYFFGEKHDKKLSIDEFLKFQEQLQSEILLLEFDLKCPRTNATGIATITETAFAELLLAYAGFEEAKRARILRRVRRKFRNESAAGITKNDYLDFFRFLNNINDVCVALTFYQISGTDIDPFTMKHVAKAVAQVDLDDHVIEVVFTLFDENQDGRLSDNEFMLIMKRRLLRGVRKSQKFELTDWIYSLMANLKSYFFKSDIFQD